MKKAHSLLLKVNRLLGGQLVERGLLRLDDLDPANEILLEKLSDGNVRDASLLRILFYETQTLKEEDLITYQVEEAGLGFCRLRSYFLSDEVREKFDPDACWTTLTVPFDFQAGFWFMASSCYLSPAVVRFWEERLDGQLVWYVAGVDDLTQILDELTKDREEAASKSETDSPEPAEATA